MMQLVNTHGPLNWVRIAQTLGSRTPKQCRERYHQNLKPTLNHEPITPEEGLQIERLVLEIGKRWAEIARRLHGRSDNAVKNWWNGSQNRRKRLDRRRAIASANGQSTTGVTATTVSAPVHGPTSTLFEDERCPRIGPTALASHGTTLPLPHSLARAPSPFVDSYGYPRQRSWSEAPLPSPCSSEPTEVDFKSSHYTTAPALGARPRFNLPIELPPLRSWQPPRPGTARLPSLSSLTALSSINRLDYSSHHSSIGAGAQLPTAPNSPVQSQGYGQHRWSRPPSDPLSYERDSRMMLAALLV